MLLTDLDLAAARATLAQTLCRAIEQPDPVTWAWDLVKEHLVSHGLENLGVGLILHVYPKPQQVLHLHTCRRELCAACRSVDGVPVVEWLTS